MNSLRTSVMAAPRDQVEGERRLGGSVGTTLAVTSTRPRAQFTVPEGEGGPVLNEDKLSVWKLEE